MSNATRTQTTSLIFIAISLAVFALGVWSKTKGPISSLFGDSEWVILIVAAVLIPLYRMQYFQDTIMQLGITDIANNLNKAISYGKVVHLGNAIQTASIVAKQIATAKEALNTYIISEKPYPERISKKVEEAISTFIARDDTIFEETCSDIGKLRIDRLQAKLGNLPDTYRPRVLRKDFDNLPTCNFIILKRDKQDPVSAEISTSAQ